MTMIKALVGLAGIIYGARGQETVAPALTTASPFSNDSYTNSSQGHLYEPKASGLGERSIFEDGPIFAGIGVAGVGAGAGLLCCVGVARAARQQAKDLPENKKKAIERLVKAAQGSISVTFRDFEVIKNRINTAQNIVAVNKQVGRALKALNHGNAYVKAGDTTHLLGLDLVEKNTLAVELVVHV